MIQRLFHERWQEKKRMNWTHIILHHSLTKDSETVSWQAIRRYHLDLGWRDIGYHFGIEIVNDEYEILIGRNLNLSGAHTQGMNNKGIGVCFVGNYDLTVPPAEMIEKAVPFLRWLIMNYRIPLENVMGHRDFADKSCPGKLFDIERLRQRLCG